jgi:hypothetical protein
MRKLVALCVQAQQQHAPVTTQLYTAAALGKWLKLVDTTRLASRLQASVWRQLQESGLLQHLAVSMADAADELSVMTECSASCGNGSSSGSDSSTSTGADWASECRPNLVLSHAQALLSNYSKTCSLLIPAGVSCLSLDVALPAAPAAARLSLAVLRACSRQQLQFGGHFKVVAAQSAHNCTIVNALVLESDFDTVSSVEGACQRTPGLRELLLSPDLVPCLAISIVVDLLELSSALGSDAVASTTSGNRAAAGSTSGGSSNSRRAGPSPTTDALRNHRGSGRSSAAAQPACGLAGSGSGSSQGSSKPGPQDSSVSLASLTPLAASLFDLLGVDHVTFMLAATTMTVFEEDNSRCVERCSRLLAVYSQVTAYQVRWCVCCQAAITCVGHAAAAQRWQRCSAENTCRLA